MRAPLIADIEADGLLPELTRIWQISIMDGPGGETVSYNDHGGRPLREALKRLRDADSVVFHGGLMYDVPAIMKVYGNTAARPDNVIDTLVLSRLGRPERDGGHSLAEWGERLGIAKVEHEDWARWSPEMETRCNGDVEITARVYERLKGMKDAMPVAYALEHRVAWEVTKMIRRGFGLDVEHCRKLVSELMAEQEAAVEKLEAVFPPILVPAKASDPVKTLSVVNRRHKLRGQLDPGVPYCPVVVEEFSPSSRQQVARRLMSRYGWKPKKFTPTGLPEISEDVLRELDYPEAKLLADYLVTDKRLQQLQAEPRSNGTGGGWLQHAKQHEGDHWRVHASLNSCRAVTGRPSCSSPNIQQVSTDKRMRRAWIPRPGLKLVGVDAEGLELRCLAHYLWRHDDGAYGKMLIEGRKEDGTDVHSVVQQLIHFYDRDETKRAEYGWLYGAGDAKLGLIAYQDAYKVGKEINYKALGVKTRSGRKPSNSSVGEAIRDKLQKGITGLERLVTDVRRQARQTGRLRGLDGRTLWVRSEHSALYLLLQSAGIIIIKHVIAHAPAVLAAGGFVEDVDYAAVMWVHDELQCEARPEVAEQVGQILAQEIVKAGPALGFRCPLAGSCDVGDSWADTH